MKTGRSDHIDETAEVDPVVSKWSRHRFSGIGERGEMDDAVGVVSREGGIERFGIENVAFDERASRDTDQQVAASFGL